MFEVQKQATEEAASAAASIVEGISIEPVFDHGICIVYSC